MEVDWDPADTHPVPSPPCSGSGGLTSKNDCITPALSPLVSCGQDEEERRGRKGSDTSFSASASLISGQHWGHRVRVSAHRCSTSVETLFHGHSSHQAP